MDTATPHMAMRCFRAGLAAVLTGSAVFTLAIMLLVTRPPEPAEWLGAVLITVWILLPYALLAVVGVRCWRRPRSLAILLAGALVLGGGGSIVYYDGFFVHGDQLSGLLFVVIPFYQLLGCALLAVLTRSWRSRLPAPDAHPGDQ